jgi:hypothetical protein
MIVLAGLALVGLAAATLLPTKTEQPAPAELAVVGGPSS